MKLLSILFLVLACLVIPAVNEVNALEKKPKGLNVKAYFDKSEYFIGENVLVHFVVSNNSDTPFRIEMGGDYRGSPRHLKFKVSTNSTNGKKCVDPHPNPVCFGGIGSKFEITKTKSFTQSLPLLRYSRIDKGGSYTVKITHDLGLKLAKNSIPIATATVKFKEPTKEEANNVIKEALALPKNHGYSMGSKQKDYLDFTIINDPIYVDFLEQHANSGNENAIRGLGSIADKSSTKALIRLANSSDKTVSQLSAKMICARLPDPIWKGQLKVRCPFGFGGVEESKYLCKKAWSQEFDSEVIEIGKKYISSQQTEDIVIGTYIIECIGTANNITEIVKALDIALESNKSEKLEKGIYPRPRGPLQELIRASKMLVGRGALISNNPKSPGQIAVFIESIDDRKPSKTLISSILTKVFADNYPYLKELAFLRMPISLAPEMKRFIEEGIKDKNPDVSIAALKLAAKVKDKSMLDSVLAATKSANEQWQLRESVNTAHSLGGYLKALKHLARRLEDEKVCEHCFTLLIEVFDSKTYQGYGCSNVDYKKDGRRLKESWLPFLCAKSNIIEGAKRIPLTRTKTSPKLFPTGFQFNLKSGEKWPN